MPIRDIQLFAATNKFAFYEKFGFEKRPINAPGMQLRYKWYLIENQMNALV